MIIYTTKTTIRCSLDILWPADACWAANTMQCFVVFSPPHASGPPQWMLSSLCSLCRVAVWVNVLPVTTISKVNAADNSIHHSVSLALPSDLFHIMLSNVSGARLLGGMMINREMRGSCERRCWHGCGINLHPAFCRLSQTWKTNGLARGKSHQ